MTGQAHGSMEVSKITKRTHLGPILPFRRTYRKLHFLALCLTEPFADTGSYPKCTVILGQAQRLTWSRIREASTTIESTPQLLSQHEAFGGVIRRVHLAA